MRPIANDKIDVVLTFPILPVIAKPVSDQSAIDSAQGLLSKVHALIKESQTNDIGLDEVLQSAEVTREGYMEAVQVSREGNVVVLKREPNECYINNYNGPVMLAWQANMDLQYVLNAYACVMYVASYIMKTDRVSETCVYRGQI